MPPRLRVHLCATAVATLLLGAGVARAADPAKDASSAAAAQALFDDAVHLMEAGRFAEACPKLAASEKLDPGAGTLLDLGTCYEKNGQTASAWATYQEAEGASKSAGHDDWAARAHGHVVELEPRLVRLVVTVPPDAAAIGERVTRDGVEVEPSAWGVALPLDPGPHEVRASAPGRTDWTTKVRLAGEGTTSTVAVPPLADTPSPPAPASAPTPAAPVLELSPTSPAWTTQRIAATVLAGVGVASLAVGSVLALKAKSDYDDAIAHDCPGGGTQCTAAGVQEGRQAHGLAGAATGAVIGGAAALAAGAVLFFVPLGHAGTAPPSSATLRVAPGFAPGHASLVIAGAW